MQRRTKRIFVDTSQIHVKKRSKADQALRLAKSNKKKLKDVVEVQNSDSSTGVLTLTAVPQVTYISSVTPVEGFEIQLKSVNIKGFVKQDLASAIIDDYRIDLVLDRRPNKAILTPTLYLGATSPTIHAFKDFGEKARFKILNTGSGFLNGDVGENSHRLINRYFKLNLKMESDTATGMAQSNIIKNALYIVAWSTASANKPTSNILVRL